ncbi:MAG: hypothetical protein P4M11_12415 [Candidatus Pacebacteria bacterium]|nr:hypothetical protein [Candidatus Paceibacterota bacterium]
MTTKGTISSLGSSSGGCSAHSLTGKTALVSGVRSGGSSKKVTVGSLQAREEKCCCALM